MIIARAPPFPWHKNAITRWTLHAVNIHSTWMLHYRTTKGDQMHVTGNNNSIIMTTHCLQCSWTWPLRCCFLGHRVPVTLETPTKSVIVTKAMSIEDNVQWLFICNCNISTIVSMFSMEVNTTMGLFNTFVNGQTITRSPISSVNDPSLKLCLFLQLVWSQ